MELRHLRAFQAVARTLNFTRAAAELNYAQSSVTEQIQALEHELGTALFDRTGRRIRLTPAGVELADYADRVLSLLDEARTVVTDRAGQPDGDLALGALETLCAYRLPAVLARFRTDCPLVRVSVGQGNRGEIYQGVRHGRFDVGFTFGSAPEDPELASQALTTDRLVVIAPVDHRLAMRDRWSPEELRGESFLATEVGCGFREMFDQTFGSAGLHGPVIAAEVTSLAALCGCVAAGMGCALLPEMAVRAHVDRGAVVARHLTGPGFYTTVTMTWLGRRERRPGVAALLGTARTVLGDRTAVTTGPPHPSDRAAGAV